MGRTTKIGMVMWDLPTENRTNAPNEVKKKFKALRKKLWRLVRHRYRCFPYNDSVYIILRMDNMQDMRYVLGQLKMEYQDIGYEANIDIITCDYDSVALKEVLEKTFIKTLSGLIKGYENANADGKIVSGMIKTSNKFITSIRGGCSNYNVNSERVFAYIDILNEKILEHNIRISKKAKTKVKWTVA